MSDQFDKLEDLLSLLFFDTGLWSAVKRGLSAAGTKDDCRHIVGIHLAVCILGAGVGNSIH